MLPIGRKQKNGFSRKKILRPSWLTKLEQNNISIINCEKQYYLTRSDWEQYFSPEFDDKLRPIAPLDPLIWDRDVLLKIFDFEYKWEVYNKKENRRWGYYVYPLLYRNKFVG